MLCCIVFAAMLGGTGCANIIPPTGGPKDTLPPVLMSALPKDSAVNIKNSKITLTFDEYVQLDNDVNSMLTVSPNPDQMPLIEARLRTVTIKLRDSLKPNTTYAINFGKALKDVNEGNPYKNFTYVFSTGSTIDDGSITGNVKIAETGQADSTLIVVLHRNLNDTAVRTVKPDYFTRLDSAGNFKFSFLPHEKFNVFVLPDDYSKKYDDSTKTFAFYNETVEASTNPQPIKMYAYQEVKSKEKPSSAAATQPGKGKSKKEDNYIRMSTNLDNNQQDILGQFVVTLNKPATKFDSSLILLTDTSFHTLKGFSVKQTDTSGLQFTLSYKWVENHPYKLLIKKDAFTDSAGNTTAKTDTFSFKTKREIDYGSIRIHFNNLDLSKNPVLQLMDGDVLVQSVVLTSNEWYQQFFNPGEYEMRILNDDNKNGVWDPGNYNKKIQPEIVRRISRKLTIKANQDSEADVNL